MKKYLAFFLAIIACFLTASCNYSNGENLDTESTAVSSSVAENTIASQTSINGEGISEHARIIFFKDVDFIVDFLTVMKGSKEDYDTYNEMLKQTLPYKYVLQSYYTEKEVASRIETCLAFPTVKNGIETSDFDYSYYTSYGYLHAIVKIEDVLYRFAYRYDMTELPIITTPSTKLDFQIGDYEVNIHYNPEETFSEPTWISGWMLVGATYVQVTVRTDDPSKVNFDWCEMKDFSDEYAHNIEDIE